MTVAVAPPVARRARSLIESRAAWLVLIAVAAASLALGSIHSGPQTNSQRRSYLDSIIKCPSCADASLAQSETSPAIELRSTIARWVTEGLTNAEIEQRVVALYGPGEILRPSNPVVWVLPLVAFAVAACGIAIVVFRHRRTGPNRPVDESGTADDEELVARARHVETLP
jgi:cytochrome c-type biogenesis protein CcmH/NrfF